MSQLMSHVRPALAAATAAVVLAAATPAGAAFVLVDDLESLSLGNVDDQGNFDTEPTNSTVFNVVDDGGNNRLQAGPITTFAQAIYNNDPAFAVGEDSPATFFFQFEFPALADGASVDVSYGAGAVPTSASDFNAFDAQFRVTGTGQVSARDGGSFTAPLATVAPDVLYNVYLAVDTAADTYDVYLTTGLGTAGDASAATRIAEDLDLRSPTMGGITAFLGITGNRTAATLTDNFYVDADAVNLSNPVPIPEPASAAALAAGVGLLSLRRRGRRA